MILEKKLLRDPDRQIYMGNSIQFDSLIVFDRREFLCGEEKSKGGFLLPPFLESNF